MNREASLSTICVADQTHAKAENYRITENQAKPAGRDLWKTSFDPEGAFVAKNRWTAANGLAYNARKICFIANSKKIKAD